VELRYRSIVSLTSALDDGGWSTPRPGPFTPGKDPVPIVEQGGWARGPVWMGAENVDPTEFRSPDLPPRSHSLYLLRYPGPIAVLILVSMSLKYIKPTTFFPFYYCRTPYWISSFFPGLAAIASEHSNWTAPYYRCIYILNYIK
jgi:hypothetical protein